MNKKTQNDIKLFGIGIAHRKPIRFGNKTISKAFLFI